MVLLLDSGQQGKVWGVTRLISDTVYRQIKDIDSFTGQADFHVSYVDFFYTTTTGAIRITRVPYDGSKEKTITLPKEVISGAEEINAVASKPN